MVSAAFPNRPFQLRDEVYWVETDVPNNRSRVTYKLWIDKTGYSPTASSGKAYRWFRLNGQYVHEFYGNGFNFVNGDNFLMAQGDLWVPHNADGTKQLLIEAAADFDILGATSLSVTIPLPTIPRASTASFVGGSSFNAGSAVQINTNRASSSFTHTIDYSIGSIKNSVIASGVGASTSWTPPMSLIEQFKNAASGAGTIRTRTYSGSTLIGTTTTNFTLKAPASVIPTFTSILHTEAVSGVAANVGKYVKGVSRLALEIFEPEGVYGSTITGYKIEILSGSTVLQTLTTRTGTSGLLNASGTLTIRATITDSRGRTATKTTTIEVLNWAPPRFIDPPTAQRSLSNGTVDIDEGTYLRVNINAAISSLMNGTERNGMNYRIRSRPYGGTTWEAKSSGPVAGTTFNSYKVVGTYSVTQAYEVLVEVYDDFATSAVTLSVPVAEIFMHWNASLGVGLGKFHEKGRLDVKGDIYSDDFLVLTGESDPVTDWNLALESGFFWSEDAANAPRSGALVGTVTRVGGGTYLGRVVQEVSIPTGVSAQIPATWRRVWTGSAWSSWILCAGKTEPVQPSLLSSFTPASAAPNYFITPSRVELTGGVYRSAAPTSFTTAFTLPADVPKPRNQVRYAGRDDLSMWVAITSAGDVQIKASGAATSGVGYMLDGIGYGY